VSLVLRTPDHAYRSAHPFVMGNGEWQDVTWAFTPPRDRRSLEIVLKRDEKMQRSSEVGTVALLVTVHPTSPLRATFDKFVRNYREAIRYVPFWTFARNSVLLVVLNIIGQLFACSMVAYAFARLRWPGRDIFFVVLLATMMLPPQVTMVPVFLIVRKLHWYNTLTPLWLPSFFGSAFFIFLLRQFLMTIPRDLEDAAKIDGCSYFGLYWRIMLPLIRPALAAVAIFQFLGSWNDFMGPLIYINDLRLTPLSLGLFQFQQEHAAEWGMLMAGSLLMTLPAILIFFLAQKHFIQGITLTGIK
jgi:ABC-type glycerol-3-phosphate transport system permease component